MIIPGLGRRPRAGKSISPAVVMASGLACAALSHVSEPHALGVWTPPMTSGCCIDRGTMSRCQSIRDANRYIREITWKRRENEQLAGGECRVVEHHALRGLGREMHVVSEHVDDEVMVLREGRLRRTDGE